MTYTLVNLPFLVATALLASAAVLVVRRRPGGATRLRRAAVGVGVALVVLFALTAVFDNVIILTGVVDYDHSLTSGIRLGVAPIEDFAYSVLAGIALPALWLLLPARRAEGSDA